MFRTISSRVLSNAVRERHGMELNVFCVMHHVLFVVGPPQINVLPAQSGKVLFNNQYCMASSNCVSPLSVTTDAYGNNICTSPCSSVTIFILGCVLLRSLQLSFSCNKCHILFHDMQLSMFHKSLLILGWNMSVNMRYSTHNISYKKQKYM